MSNPSPVKKFTSTYQPPNELKRVRKQRTILLAKLGIKNIEDMKTDVMAVWAEFIHGTDEQKAFAAREMSKYIFPQRRELSGELNGQIKVEIVYKKDEEDLKTQRKTQQRPESPESV